MLTLASRSPQRQAILTQLGIPHIARPSGVRERTDGDPQGVVLHNALLKAGAVPGKLVLGVDTIVVLDGRIHGKPADEAIARETLAALSGRRHSVISGFALLSQGAEPLSGCVETRVSFRTLTPELIAWYLATGEWRERAGGYAIQGRGAALIESIEGDYLNVVGLPIARLLTLRPDLLSS